MFQLKIELAVDGRPARTHASQGERTPLGYQRNEFEIEWPDVRPRASRRPADLDDHPLRRSTGTVLAGLVHGHEHHRNQERYG